MEADLAKIDEEEGSDVYSYVSSDLYASNDELEELHFSDSEKKDETIVPNFSLSTFQQTNLSDKPESPVNIEYLIQRFVDFEETVHKVEAMKCSLPSASHSYLCRVFREHDMSVLKLLGEEQEPPKKRCRF